MSFQDILQWWNLIYIAPLAVSVIWIVATVLAGAHGGDGGGHAGHGHAAGHDVGHGIGHSVHDVVHGVEQAITHTVHHGDAGHGHGDHAHGDHGGHGHAHSHNHGSGNDESFAVRMLSILGFGQIPITMMIGVFMLCWGMFGMIANRFFALTMKYPAIYIWPSLIVAFIGSLFATRLMVSIIARLIPPTETFAISRFGLVGTLGRTVYTTTESTGTVNVKDQYGTVHRVQAKTEPGVEPLSAGVEVMIIDFDDADKRYVVKKSTL